MANVDGYYLVVGTKEETIPGSNPPLSTTVGGDFAFYFSNFKAGGKNDGEAPDQNVTINPIFPISPNIPAPTEVILDDGHGGVGSPCMFSMLPIHHIQNENNFLMLRLTSRYKFRWWSAIIRKVGQVRQNRGQGGKCCLSNPPKGWIQALHYHQRRRASHLHRQGRFQIQEYELLNIRPGRGRGRGGINWDTRDHSRLKSWILPLLLLHSFWDLMVRSETRV